MDNEFASCIVIGLLIGILGASAIGLRFTAHVARFFARSAYRFLVVLIFAAVYMLFGFIVAYRQREQALDSSAAELYFLLICSLSYSLAAGWCARRIRRGTWQRIWVQALKHLGQRL